MHMPCAIYMLRVARFQTFKYSKTARQTSNGEHTKEPTPECKVRLAECSTEHKTPWCTLTLSVRCNCNREEGMQPTCSGHDTGTSPARQHKSK